jgi:FkbM family methyltransferase
MNLAVYLDEIRFACAATQTWQSRLALLRATARFHFHNFRRAPKSDRSPVELDIDIGGIPRRIVVRPYAGDVFILYEVLASETYKVPDDIMDPASVKTIVDCGGNVGMTALYLASRHRNAKIVTVEPDPVNFELLCRNTRSEPRIVPVKAALVGGSSRTVVLSQDRPAWGNSIGDEGGATNGIEVAGLTLPDLCMAHGLPSIDILKVDIEGAEAEVFAAPGFLRMVRFVMIELHGAYTLDRFRSDIAGKGFTARGPSPYGRPRAVTAFPERLEHTTNRPE